MKTIGKYEINTEKATSIILGAIYLGIGAFCLNSLDKQINGTGEERRQKAIKRIDKQIERLNEMKGKV